VSSHDQPHEKVECHGPDACREAAGDASNIILIKASHASHGVAQVAIHYQVASQRTGVDNVQNADMAMCFRAADRPSSSS
jgi:hypothetical protein